MSVPPSDVPFVVPAGEHAVLVRCGTLAEVHRLRRVLVAAAPAGVVDVVPGWSSLLVVGRSADALAREVGELLDAQEAGEADATSAGVFEVPTVYDGADLADVAAETGLTVREVVDLHSAPTYTVAFLGFIAGFPYLSGLDPRLDVPRLANPRVRVPAGSVAIAGGQAGVYPSEAPGGWRLLGHTTAVRFDPRADPPTRLLPGDRVRFVPVRRLATRDPAADARGTKPAVDAPSAAAHLGVVAASTGCLVVDAGRRGIAHLGVPRGGAFDRAAHALGNRLVGNPSGAAGLEVPLGGLQFEATSTVTVAVTGASVAVQVVRPGGEVRQHAPLMVVTLEAGERLELGTPSVGVRTYVAVRGGVGTEIVLGSRSGTAVRAGDRVPVLPADGFDLPWLDPVPPGRGTGSSTELRIVPGPDLESLPPETFEALRRNWWTVDAASDRTGIRLSGALVATAGDATMPSGGVLPGFVQLLPDGTPVILGPDAGTTGGYPVVAVVSDGSLDRLAQLRPGDRVRFATR